jgi:hypothetical protein
MIGGLNIGYAFSKYRVETGSGLFPSVRGPVDAGESLGEEQGIILQDGAGQEWYVGDAAIRQARVLSRHEGADWIKTDAYRMLWLAAFSEMTRQFRGVTLQIVTGLPISDFGNRGILADWLKSGVHEVRRRGRQVQRFEIGDVVVFPELMGIAFALTISSTGQQVDNRFSSGHFIVTDMGGHTTNFLGLDNMAPLRPEARCEPIGGFKIVSQVQAALNVKYPGLNYEAHEVIEVIKRRYCEWRGRMYDVGGIVDDAVGPTAEAVLGIFSQLYNGASRHRGVVLGGGCAHLVAEHVRRAFPYPDYPHDFVYVFGDQSDEADPELVGMVGGIDPVFGNAEGFYRYGVSKWG